MKGLAFLLSMSLLTALGQDKVGITPVVTEAERNFGVGHTGNNADYIQQLRNAVLPVSLLYFNLNTTERSVRLEWKTASEANNSHFILKRSNDGKQFTEIARIPGGGNSSSVTQYQYVDHLPLLGQSYYQLDQVNYDGSKVSLKVITANYNLGEQKVFAHFTENGALSAIINGVVEQENVLIAILDMKGQVIAEKKVNLISGINYFQFDNIFFQPGVYIVSIRLKMEIINQKVIK